MDNARLPADLLHDAAARIRWQQRLLCSLPVDARVDMDTQDVQGLYLSLEDIYQGIIEALSRMEAPA
ncbi:MAG: hypothetical protein SPI23_04545 [Desulfovibrio sp.]|jgi:hypothetical protein|uniref:hypothetical protein n=1 Tax=Desulfovibrio TaxID=872 RepID=UPI0026F308A3|nr:MULTISPECIES: hypothetical protein [Desulfovibrio]MDY6233927.1 hypothetical protein [Desulfovibrio sp.]